MGLVVNNVVKLDWDEDGWLQTKAKKDKRVVFIFASKVYQSSLGVEIPVFFDGAEAFLWISDNDSSTPEYWTAKELVSWVKSEYSSRFPHQYDEFISLEGENDSLNMAVLEKWGLTEYADDILARLEDLAPYSVETETEIM